jgi:hypothetical protein
MKSRNERGELKLRCRRRAGEARNCSSRLAELETEDPMRADRESKIREIDLRYNGPTAQ